MYFKSNSPQDLTLHNWATQLSTRKLLLYIRDSHCCDCAIRKKCSLCIPYPKLIPCSQDAFKKDKFLKDEFLNCCGNTQVIQKYVFTFL